MKKKTEQDYHNLAKELGITWLGGVLPKDTHAVTFWLCSNNHRFSAKYSDINRSNKDKERCGCHIYAVEGRRNTEDDYHNLAKKKGFQWVGKELPSKVSTNTLWRCVNGHEWEARYFSIKAGTSRCPHCSGYAKKTKKDYYILAEMYNFKWLGKRIPSNTSIKTLWECKKGHEFEATYTNVKSGWGCKFCSGLAKKTKKRLS